jgi:hypothetical protein
VDQSALVEVSKTDDRNSKVDPIDKTNETTDEASKSHDRNSKLDPIDKTDETTDEADNLVSYSRPLHFGMCFVSLNLYRSFALVNFCRRVEFISFYVFLRLC